MGRFLLPSNPDAPMGVWPVVGLVLGQWVTAFFLGLVASMFTDQVSWVSAVSTITVAQSLGMWWSRASPGSLTDRRRWRLVLVSTAAQTVFGAVVLAYTLAPEIGWTWLLVGLAIVAPLQGVATWWGLGQGARLALRSAPPPSG